MPSVVLILQVKGKNPWTEQRKGIYHSSHVKVNFFFGLGLSHTYSRYMKTILCNLENGEERVKEKFQQQTIIDATRKQINETYMRSQFSG